MPIEVLEERVFLLHSRHMTYAMRVDDAGRLIHAYWGGKIARGADFLGETPPFMEPIHCPPEQFFREECSVFGNLRFKETSLKVTFPDGTRDFRGVATGWRVDGEELTVTLEDERYPLQTLLHYRIWPDCDVLEKWREVVNTGGEPFTLERCHSAEFALPGTDYESVNCAGRWGGEFGLRSAPVGAGKQVYESLYGLTAHSVNPFFAVHRGADEEKGAVYFGALAWSGNFKIVVENVCGAFTSILAGVSDTDALWSLDSGAHYETPHVYAGRAEGFGGMSHALHRFARRHVLPDVLAEKSLPVLYNSWYATEFNVSLEQQKALAQKAAALGVDLFVMDDGWFKGRVDSTAGLGDWTADPQKFPGGLGELIQCVNGLGMDFGLWVEPEMVNPNSDLFRAHPNWILRYPNREPRLWRSQYMLNLADKEVENYLFILLDRLLCDHNIAYLKWDMNRYAAEMGCAASGQEEWRSLWRRHTEGFYALTRRLRKAHPEVELEACASGGGRVDFGTMALFDEFWPSDNTDPLDRLSLQEHYTLVYPAKCMRAWITDDALNGRDVPLRFKAHCAMCGALGVGTDLNRAEKSVLDELAGYVALYKRHRDTIQLGELYRLSSLEQSPIQLVQYQREESGVVFAFLRGGSLGRHFYPCRLRGLGKDTVYRCVWEGHTVEKSGAYLMEHGLTLELHGDYASLLITLEAL